MPLSEEQKKAASERMKAMHAAKAAQVAADKKMQEESDGYEEAFKQPEAPQEPTAEEKQETVTITKEQFETLLARLESVESAKVTSTPVSQGVSQVAADGRIFGIQTPYSLSPEIYNDPREVLYNLPILEQYGFKKNYRLDWVVEVQNYETKYGTSFSVPKFKLKLRKLMLNEETGEPITFEQNGKTFERGYLVQAGIFFVDPAEAVATARELGLPIDDANSHEFLDRMRLELYKRWLLECMKPPRPQPSKGQKQVVIGGTAYLVEEWNQNI